MSGEKYDLFIIVTNRSVKYLVSFLSPFCQNEDDIVSIVRDFYRDTKTKKYYENGQKLALISNSLYENIIINKLQLTIKRYEEKAEHLADESESFMHYYYPILNNVDNNELFQNKLDALITWGVIKRSDIFIHTKYGICEFSNDVPPRQRIILKFILDSTSLRVSWCRKKLFFKVVPHFQADNVEASHKKTRRSEKKNRLRLTSS